MRHRAQKPFTHTFIVVGNLESPFSLLNVFGQKPTWTQGCHAKSTQRGPQSELKLRGIFLLLGDSEFHCITMPPSKKLFSPVIQIHISVGLLGTFELSLQLKRANQEPFCLAESIEWI